MKLEEIIASVQKYHPDADTERIRKAYNFVMFKHQGQTRASGEPYITHVEEVAYLATKIRLDGASIAAALLHDTVEDTETTVDDLRAEFGNDVAELVDGVTKLTRVNFRSRAEHQAENFRKMLLAMAKDIRVLLVKLCDRTHNMRTLQYLSESRRVRIARETLEIFAPLAHRLGIHWMKSELEDLALRYLKPEVYENLKQNVSKKKKERERYISSVVYQIVQELSKHNLKASVTGRPKHFYSIYQKMIEQGLEFSEIHDLIAFRIIVDSTMECYAALGIIHSAWKPIPGRFKDYIAMPKPNRYQSLHTTVIGPEGSRIEIQIRTAEMHDIAEKGIAAHWMYKTGGSSGKKLDKNMGVQLTWLRELVESQSVISDPHEFMSTVKADLFPQEVYVFSPKGDLVSMPSGATPIDFAYSVHTEIGHRCFGARVNGQQVPLTHKLQNGDTVEIITSKNQVPNKDWLNIVVSAKAKQRIRSWLRAQERARSIDIGREVLGKDLRKIRRALSAVEKNGTLERISQSLGCNDINFLYAEIGYGKISSQAVIAKLAPEISDIEERLAEEEGVLKKIFQTAAKNAQNSSSILVSGLDDVVFRFARCCEPLPGDELVGYITRGRGVTIHRRSCNQTLGFDPQRLIEVAWDSSVHSERRVRLQVRCVDRVGMLARITQCISQNGASIVSAVSSSTKDGKAMNTFEINIKSARQFDTISNALQNMEGVIKVERYRRNGGMEGAPF